MLPHEVALHADGVLVRPNQVDLGELWPQRTLSSEKKRSRTNGRRQWSYFKTNGRTLGETLAPEAIHPSPRKPDRKKRPSGDKGKESLMCTIMQALNFPVANHQANHHPAVTNR